MDHCGAFFHARDGEPIALLLNREVPDFATLEDAGRAYQQEAQRFVGVLCASAPGGLVDAIFADLARRKASVFCVAHGLNHGAER